MFTGLVQECGRLTSPPIQLDPGDPESPVRLQIGHSQDMGERLQIGASLAVNGVCLTLITWEPGASTVELSPETLARTTLGRLDDGAAVNLEAALRLGDPLGGHWVQGHVDTTVRLIGRTDLEAHRELVFELPDAYAAYVVEKGSVTLDGVSLTVASLGEDRFSIAVIPHTLEVTTLSDLEIGEAVNLEVDILAKYVQRAVDVQRGRAQREGTV